MTVSASRAISAVAELLVIVVTMVFRFTRAHVSCRACTRFVCLVWNALEWTSEVTTSSNVHCADTSFVCLCTDLLVCRAIHSSRNWPKWVRSDDLFCVLERNSTCGTCSDAAASNIFLTQWKCISVSK